jgi:hypothetical protein
MATCRGGTALHHDGFRLQARHHRVQSERHHGRQRLREPRGLRDARQCLVLLHPVVVRERGRLLDRRDGHRLVDERNGDAPTLTSYQNLSSTEPESICSGRNCTPRSIS